MSDNEIKIYKSNTFEQWRQKSNELSFNVGDDSLLDSRLTDRVFSYTGITGDNRLSIVANDGGVSSPTMHFHQLPDSKIDNFAGYIILKHGTSTTGFQPGQNIYQGSPITFSGIVESVVSIDGKPKILLAASNGTFSTSDNLISNAGTTISSSNIERLLTESYDYHAVRVQVNGQEIPQNLNFVGFHVPKVVAKISRSFGTSTQALVDGSLIYQGGSGSTEAEIIDTATWFGRVYRATTGAIYLKLFGGSGSFNSGSTISILGAAGTIASGGTFTLYTSSADSGFVIEFNSQIIDNATVTVSATDLVSAVNEVQDDIGEIANLQTTDKSDVVNAINELEVAARGTSLTNYTLGTDSTDGLVGGVNELENIIRDATTEVTDYEIQTDAHNIIAAIDELEVAARGDRSATNYTISTNSTEGLVGGVNELDTAARGTSNNLVSDILSTEAKNLAAAINELDDQIGTADDTATIAFSGGPAAAASDSNLLDGVNTIDAKIGQVDITDVATGESTITGAIAQLHDEVGDVDISTIDADTTTVTGALVQLHDEVGDTTTLNTTATNLTAAVNEHGTEIGAMVFTGANTTTIGGQNISITTALNSLDTEIGEPSLYDDNTYYGDTTIAGTLNKLQVGMESNDTEIHNLMELIDGERPGTIFVAEGTSIAAFQEDDLVHQNDGGNTFNAVVVSSGNNKILVKDITGTFNPDLPLYKTGTSTLVSAANLIRIATVDTSVSVTGLTSGTLTGGLAELAGRTISAGDGLSGGGTLAANRQMSVSLSSTAPGLEFTPGDLDTLALNANSSWDTYNAAFEINANDTKSGNLQLQFSNNPVADQKFVFNADSSQLTISPNVAIAAGTDNAAPWGGNPLNRLDPLDSNDGGTFLETSTFIQDTNLRGKTVYFTGTIPHASNSLDGRYTLVAFIKYLNADYSLGAQDEVTIVGTSSTSDQTFSLELTIPDTNILPQLGFTLSGRNAVAGEQLANGLILTNLSASYQLSSGSGALTIDDTVLRTITANGGQTINQDLTFTSGNTVTYPTGSTLDIRDGNLLLGGGGTEVSFETSFIKLAGNIATGEGISIDRGLININGGIFDENTGGETDGAVAGATDVELLYRENALTDGANYPSQLSNYDRAWEVSYMDSNVDGSVWTKATTPIVTFDNAKHLVESSTESGISVGWDDANKQFTFNVNDPTISLTGDVTGSATMSDLGNVSISTAVQPNSVALGTDTTGNYMSGISGTTNEIAVTHTAGEGSSATVGLADAVQITTSLDIQGDADALITDEDLETESLQASFITAGGGIVGKDLIVRGSLTVNDDFNVVTSNEVNIGDNTILLNSELANDAVPAFTYAGINVNRGSLQNAELVFSEATNRWQVLNPFGDDNVNQNATYSNIITENDDFDSWTLGVNSSLGYPVTNGSTVYFVAGSYTPETSEGLGDQVIADNGIIELSVDAANRDVYIEHKAFDVTPSAASTSDGTGIVSLTLDQGHVSAYETYDFDNRYIKTLNFYYDNDGSTTQQTVDYDNNYIRFIGDDTNSDGATVDVTFDGTGAGVMDILDISIAVTNDDKGSTQNIFKTVMSDTTELDASSNDSTIKFIGGTSIDLTSAAEVTTEGSEAPASITINHANTSTLSAGVTTNAGSNFIQNLTIDDNGHLTGITAAAVPVQDSINTAVGPNLDTEGNSALSEAEISASVGYIVPNSTPPIQYNSTESGIYFIEKQHTGDAAQVLYDYNGMYLVAATDEPNANDGTSSTGKILSGIQMHANASRYFALGDHTFYNTLSETSELVTFTHDGNITLHQANATVDGVDISALETTVNAITSDTGAPAILANGGTPTFNTDVTAEDLRTLIGAGISSTDTEYTMAVDTSVTYTTNGQYIELTNTSDSNDKQQILLIGDGTINVTRPSSEITGRIEISTTAEENQNAYSSISVYDESSTTQPGTMDALTDAFNTVQAGGKSSSVKLFSGNGVSLRSNTNSIQFNVLEDLSGSVTAFGYNNDNYMLFDSTAAAGIHFAGQREFAFMSNGNFHADGNIIAYSTTTSSDKKLKDNIEKVEGALELVSQLDGVTFNWKKDGKASAGVIAQNVEEVLPSAVSDTEDLNGEDSHKVVDYNQLSALFIEAIKELKEENSQLKAAIEELKNINNTK